METIIDQETERTLKIISTDRVRTNLLKTPEQRALAFLVQRIPSWVNSDMLTFIGLLGSLSIMLSFILAAYVHPHWLLLGLFGFAINWFGDSLDGRLAFYRNKSRKWYGFALDITIDWLSILLVGWGYIIYTSGEWEVLGYGFVVLYGWSIINTLLKYKVTGEYAIDPGLFGPTEGRILLMGIFLAEVLFPGSIVWSLGLLTAFILSINIVDSRKLLRLADEADRKAKLKEKEKDERKPEEKAFKEVAV
jgi:hypothetical protein